VAASKKLSIAKKTRAFVNHSQSGGIRVWGWLDFDAGVSGESWNLDWRRFIWVGGSRFNFYRWVF
jgi:hypothetical protein